MDDMAISNERLNAVLAAGFALNRGGAMNLFDVSGEVSDDVIVAQVRSESGATPRNSESIVFFMRQWLKVRFRECMNDEAAHTVTYRDFQDVFNSAIESSCRNGLMNYATAACLGRSRIDSELNSQQLYIAQMEWVSVPDKQQYKAAQDYIIATINRQAWAEDDSVGPQDVERFEQKLVAGYNGKCHQVNVAYGDKSEEVIGLARFESCLSPEHCRSILIGNRDALDGTVEGSYHMLANDALIGWHPKWQERVNAHKERYGHTA